MSREELRWLFDTDLLRNCSHYLTELFDRFLGIKYVDNADAVLALSGNMNQEALEREVGWRLHAALAVREPANDFLVLLLSEAGNLV
ncbi:MAG TPA: hypothetical protein VFP67_07220, partial [Acidimicrobiia bacterium]|nr:hypothetical protein [Acidimicrobiia bacterium]